MALLFWNLCLLGDDIMGFFLVFFLSCPEKEHKECYKDLYESEKRGREIDTSVCSDAVSLCLILICLAN